jgi:CheY-like chemotaxis protein
MRKFILIVDDDHGVGDAIALICRSGGHSVQCFRDPRLLIEALPTLPTPDLLITDYQMPHMNGLELIQHCKAVMPALKTISVSGALVESDLEAYPIKPDAILPKPFRRKELFELIEKIFKQTK